MDIVDVYLEEYTWKISTQVNSFVINIAIKYICRIRIRFSFGLSEKCITFTVYVVQVVMMDDDC